MEFIADFHLHSKYSRGTSKQMTLENIYRWGKIKGIQVIGTGDFTHPGWFKEIQDKLEPAEPGLFKLKPELAKEEDKSLPYLIKKQLLRYILTAEISSIYSKGGKVRKVHNIVVAPDIKTVAKINTELQKIGNLSADGRPILGLDSKRLLEIILKVNKDGFLIPAHIWTPWFSLFGSKSGFDSIEEAFEELAPHVRAIETGLSSDPFMNWRLSELENISIISNSDAHSHLKLGREANVMDCKIDYFDIIGALKTNDQRLKGTIEFFPEEGKYYYDGHRACGVRFTPQETQKYKGICPKCGRPLVVGVDYRVHELADKDAGYKPKKHKTVEYIIPLVEILAQINEVKKPGKRVLMEYEKIYNSLGNEFDILRKIPISDISKAGYCRLAEGIKRMRKGNVQVDPGYDGVFGVIKVFKNREDKEKFGR